MGMGHKAEFSACNGDKSNHYSCISRANTYVSSLLFFLKLRYFLNSLFLFTASQFFCFFGEMLVEVLRLLHDTGLC